MCYIKDFNLEYAAPNGENTFSEGDPITGTVSFKLRKHTKIKSLAVKAKGDAEVCWSEGAENEKLYHNHRRYFKLQEYLITEFPKGTILPKGIHRFNFRFQIPKGDMPPSFKGAHGNIVYMLEAKICRSWRFPTIVQSELKFFSKSFPQPGLRESTPQSDSLVTKISKGEVQMSATVNTKFCSPGDTLSVVAKICNSSSKKMKPTFSLDQRAVFHDGWSSITSDRNACEMVGETIAKHSEKTVSCQMKVPDLVNFTLHNCDIISVDYYLKVYLDFGSKSCPLIEFPLVIIPSAPKTVEAVRPNPPGDFGGPSTKDLPSPAFPAGAHPVPSYQGPVEAPRFPTAAASAVQHQAPTAPPLLEEQEEQQETPPSHTSPLPPPQETHSWTGSDPKS